MEPLPANLQRLLGAIEDSSTQYLIELKEENFSQLAVQKSETKKIQSAGI